MIPTSEHPINGWTPLVDTLIVPHTEAEYERLVAMLDELIDTVGEDEGHYHTGRLPSPKLTMHTMKMALSLLKFLALPAFLPKGIPLRKPAPTYAM